MQKIWISEGEHKISLTKGWGWIYALSDELCNPNATKAAKSLYRYLMSIYGSYTLSGQHSTEGMASDEFNSIERKTGKTPAVIEIDLLKTTTPFSEEYKNFDPYIDRVTTFDKKGGIVVLNWHWYAPEKYILNSADQPWWKGFYTEATNIDLAKIMSGEDKEGLALLDEDIDIIAEALKTLQKKKIPVLFRPLHEASGGWFWWGASGAEPYKELYIHLYDRLTNYHKLNNIIWVWNGDSAEWYPGDEYVDIASTDIYADKHEYSSQINKFIAVGEASGGKKPVALAENGVQIDPDMMERDNVYWLYFCTWYDNGQENFISGTDYNDPEKVKEMYQSDYCITLSELPKDLYSNEVITPPTPDIVWGDANCDGEVRLNDAILVLQAIGNPEKYGVQGTDPTHITEKGIKNSDVFGSEDGLTSSDALSIQKFTLHLCDLPVTD